MPAHFLPAKVELTAAEREDVRPFFFTSSFRAPKEYFRRACDFPLAGVFDHITNRKVLPRAPNLMRETNGI
jgi:hypothetical protein